MAIITDVTQISDGLATTFVGLSNSTVSLATDNIPRLVIGPDGNITLGQVGAPISLVVNGLVSTALSNATSTSGNVILDFSQANNFHVYLSAAAVLGAPINASVGQSGIIFVVQPTNTTATVSYNSAWKWPNGTAPVATAVANAVDGIAYVVRSTSPLTIAGQFISNFS